MTVRAAALCMGYGGGELALASFLDVELAWYAEVDPDCSGILAERWPNVPNLGDLTAIGWADVEPVDVVTAGYPCQPFSQAGARQGEDDERHLWPSIADGLRQLRPAFVFLENVRGHLSLGFDRVLADLDELGYSVEWSLLAAADVGACHGRQRLWVAATLEGAPPAEGTPCGYRDAEGWTGPQVGLWDEPVRLRPPDAGCVRDGIMYGRPRLAPAAPTVGLMPTPAADESDPTEEFAAEMADQDIDPHERLYLPGRKWHTQRTLRRVAATLLPTPSVADSLGGHHSRGGDRSGEALLGGIRYLLPDAEPSDLLPTPRTGPNRASRRAMVTERQWSAPGLEQALELGRGELPREFESWDEVQGRSRVLPTPTTSDAKGPSPNHGGTTSEAIDELVPTPTAIDAHGSRRRTARKPHWTSADGVTLTDFTLLLPTPAAADGDRGPDYARAERDASGDDDLVTTAARAELRPEKWGPYAAAIARHEALTRPAPEPVNDRRQLAPEFVEWMQMLPGGWVTDLIPRRTSALRILGNGIVPACGAVAWSWLLRRLAAL